MFGQAVAVDLEAPVSLAIANEDEDQPSAADQNTTITPVTSADQIKGYKYVTDKLTVTLRSGQSNKHKILRTLSSGTRLGILETADDYSRVRSSSGLEGWVLSRFLDDAPIARHRLKQAEERVQSLEKDKKQLRTEIDQLHRTTQSMLATKNELSERNEDLNIELARIRKVAAQPLKLSDEVARMSKDNAELENDNDLLQDELRKIRDSSEKQWFMMGAGTIILGLAIGLLAPKLRRRRKSDWENL
jgi:SH3 domain protein